MTQALAPVKCNRRVSTKYCKLPGDFTWQVVHKRSAKGEPVELRDLINESADKPTHLWLVDPLGNIAFLALKPDTLTNGASWSWNGNLDCPTLTPSINDRIGGWHGFLTDGILTTV